MSWSVDPMHTQVEFSAKHMGIMTVKGAFTGVSAAIDFNEDDFTASSVEATIDARTLRTHDDRRDAHLKSADFLDVEQFPTITFKSKRVEKKGDELVLVGEFTMHGVTKELSLPARLSGPVKDPWGNNRIGLEIKWKLSRKDYGMTYNKALETGGLVVGDEVQIDVNAEAVKATKPDN